jgi:hypothetical protein
MARDEGLEELVRDGLAGTADLEERKMFGGLAWLLNGNLLCAASQRGLLVRLGKGRDAWALETPDVTPAIMGGRHMQGWVRSGPSAYGDDAVFARLIREALTYVGSLPAK